MGEIGTLINSLCHIGFIVYILSSIAEIKKILRDMQRSDVPDTNDGDIISKQTVLDTISELNAISFYEAQEDSKECYYELRQAIKDLSPVKQEPQTGHWIQVDSDKCKCDQCGITQFIAMYPNGNKNYCPNCGAKMEV